MNQAHARFQEWLAAGANGEPLRDLAVHASVCAICQRAIAAFDRLAAIDPGRSGMPVSAIPAASPKAAPPRVGAEKQLVPPMPSTLAAKLRPTAGVTAAAAPVAAAATTSGRLMPATPSKPPKPPKPTGREREVITRKGLTRVGRLAGAAAGVIFSAVVLGFGVSQLISFTRTGGVVGVASPTPGQSDFFSTTAEPTTSVTPVPTEVPTPIPTPVPTAPPKAGAPSAPRSVKAVVSIGHIALSWSAPSSNGGSAVTRYEIYKDGAGSPFKSTTARSYTDTVGNGATHVYRVTAVNSVGSSAYSNAASGTTPNVPGPPLNLVATGGQNQITLTWSAPGNNGSAITRYDIYRDGSATAMYSVTTLSKTDTGLGDSTTHSYIVKAVNAVGSSPGASASATTAPSRRHRRHLHRPQRRSPTAPTPAPPDAPPRPAPLGSASHLTWTTRRQRRRRPYGVIERIRLRPDRRFRCVSMTSCNDSSVTIGQTYDYVDPCRGDRERSSHSRADGTV